MNLSDQSSGNALKQHGAHTQGSVDNVYPPVASERGRDVALADVDLSDQAESHAHAMHDSADGTHAERRTHALGTGGGVPTLDLDVHAMGHSAFPLDGAGPGQDDEHVVHSENNLSIDLPLEGVDRRSLCL